jgi:NCAIR mutase (PurE)-related protein
VRDIIDALARGELTPEAAEVRLRALQIDQVGEFAHLDVFRANRTGVPEVVFAEGKPPQTVPAIVERLVEASGYALVSRTTPEIREGVTAWAAARPGTVVEQDELARCATVMAPGFAFPDRGVRVGIITAGTSDVRVAKEAAMVLRAMGVGVSTAYDLGIAGIHRIFGPLKAMVEAGVRALIVVAGMEGALPGVVASLVDVPVIGVPVAAGYGFGGDGLGALTTMLQSCAPGLAVVNIENGVGAAAMAGLIALQRP